MQEVVFKDFKTAAKVMKSWTEMLKCKSTLKDMLAVALCIHILFAPLQSLLKEFDYNLVTKPER